MKVTLGTRMTLIWGHVRLEIGTTRRAAEIDPKLRRHVWAIESHLEQSVFSVWWEIVS